LRPGKSPGKLPGSLQRQSLVFFTLLLSFITTTHTQAAELKLVTDIAPIHSLVSMVAGEHASVTLLVPPSQSPHGFSLKPSQRRMLDKAQLVVILSHNFTPSLSRHLNSSASKTTVLSLSSSNEQHTQAEDSSVKEDHSFGIKRDYDLINDPHTWLNPENAIRWLDKIAASLIQIDEAQAEQYAHNAMAAKQRLLIMHESIKESLSPVRDKHYIVYHDAYQHFAKSYALQVPIAIALSDARAPGAAKLRAVRKQAEHVNCAFSEVLHNDAIVDMVTERLSLKRAILDPIGSSQPIGQSLYPNLMHALANRFNDCLSG